MNSNVRCRKCSKMISNDEDFLYDDNRPMHLHCYRCSHCHRSLAGEFYYRQKIDDERRLVCEQCFFRLAPICFFCLKIIDEISLNFAEKIYHPLCFRCDRCENSFKGAEVFPFENEKFCSKCFAEIQEKFSPISSKIFAERCSTCRKQFQPADFLVQHEFNGKIHLFHSSCFRCEICRRNLSNSIYFSPNDPNENLTFQCEFCHRTSITAESICSKCFQPSNDQMILYQHRWFHDDCFVCKKCQFHLKNLSRIIVESDGFLCERCHRS